VALSWVLSWPVVGVGFGQAVGRVWAVVRVSVERVWVGTGGVLVQEGAGNLILILGAVILQAVLVAWLASFFRRHQGLVRRYWGPQGGNLGYCC
jgi:hypothetical protein